MKKFVFFQKWTKSPDMRSAPLCVTRTRNDIPAGFAVQSNANLLHGEGGEGQINVTCQKHFFITFFPFILFIVLQNSSDFKFLFMTQNNSYLQKIFFFNFNNITV